MFKLRCCIVLGLLATLGIADTQVRAQDEVPVCRPCQPSYCPHPSADPTQPIDPSAPFDPAQSVVPQSPLAMSDSFRAVGASRGFLGSSIAPAGAGGATAVGMNMTPVTVIRPLISPGLLTSANVESPYPVDRLSFSYSYYDRFKVLNTLVDTLNGPGGLATSTSRRQTGFNLHRYDVMLEKTLFDGSASVYVRAPYLDATDNTFNFPITGAGNVNAGFKVNIIRECETNNVLSAGLTVAAPTSRDGIFTRDQRFNPGAPGMTAFQFVDVNPTFIQPWIGGQLNGERMFVQWYAGLIFSSPNDVVTIFNPSVTVGYSLYEDHCGCGTISSITPVVSVQGLIPDSDEDRLLDFSDQAFVTPGVQVGLGERATLTGGVAIPVTGPKAFDLGVTVGINFLY